MPARMLPMRTTPMTSDQLDAGTGVGFDVPSRASASRPGRGSPLVRGSPPVRTWLVLLLALALGVPLGGVATAQETPEPELTWAPLVTLPPIVAPPISSRVDLADGFRLGDADAPVAIEVWEDFQCPYCQAFTFQIEPALVERFVGTGQASLTFRQLPFLGEESRWAAVAASLAAEQDLFWPFHDYLFSNLLGENVGSYDLERLLAMGEAAGLDIGRFREGLTLEQARQRFAEIQAEIPRGCCGGGHLGHAHGHGERRPAAVAGLRHGRSRHRGGAGRRRGDACRGHGRTGGVAEPSLSHLAPSVPGATMRALGLAREDHP